MNRPEFTREQEDWMCEIIGDWYLLWKIKIAPTQHSLEFAKEQLKAMLCADHEAIATAKNYPMYPRE